LIRAYVAAVETSADMDEEKLEWAEWAKQKADWYDPTVAGDDKFFGKREHDKEADAKALKETYFAWQFN
jgi:hypothetical protein